MEIKIMERRYCRKQNRSKKQTTHSDVPLSSSISKNIKREKYKFVETVETWRIFHTV